MYLFIYKKKITKNFRYLSIFYIRYIGYIDYGVPDIYRYLISIFY